MNVKELLTKYQGVLEGGNVTSGLFCVPTLAGQFEGRQTQMGVRKVPRNGKEVFYRISFLPFLSNNRIL